MQFHKPCDTKAWTMDVTFVLLLENRIPAIVSALAGIFCAKKRPKKKNQTGESIEEKNFKK